jgi:hypothetical protein
MRFTAEKIHRLQSGERRADLQRQNVECLPWHAREPSDFEVRRERLLSGHEQLPDMCNCPFIGFADYRTSSDAAHKWSQRGDRHHLPRHIYRN